MCINSKIDNFQTIDSQIYTKKSKQKDSWIDRKMLVDNIQKIDYDSQIEKNSWIDDIQTRSRYQKERQLDSYYPDLTE